MHHFTEADLPAIARLLRAGGVVLLPTDTIYGLHAVATNARAVGRITQLKGREDTKPFVVLGSSIAQLRELGVVATDELLAQLGELWPAPLTVILPLREAIPASRGAATLAVRIPASDWLRELIAQTGPLVSTSANRSGEPPTSDPKNLARDLKEALDGLLDAGPREGEASAIVDLTSTEPRFIREGERSFTQKVWKTLRKSL
ncbi:MAG TPA: L-threonylcarbamoyladenylate synthase [Thermoanaerobaculia bacterium]